MENWIRDTIGKTVPNLLPNFAVIPHPIPLAIGINVKEPLELPVRVGFLGLATPQKGFAHFVDLATDERWQNQNSVEFDLIGRLHPDMATDKLAPLFGRGDLSKRIDRSEYVSRLERCHLVFTYLDRSHYAYAASGSLLDAIAYQKPLIGGGLLEDDAQISKFGKIGLLSAPEQIFGNLQHFVTNLDPKPYSDMVDNMWQLRRDRELESTVVHIRRCFISNTYDSVA